MSKSRRNDDSDLTRAVGILFLELVGAVVLINLAQFAHQEREELSQSAVPRLQQQENASQISLPKASSGRYNVRL